MGQVAEFAGQFVIDLLLDPLILAALVVPAWLTARLLTTEHNCLQGVSDTLLLTVTLVSIPVFTICLLSRSYLSATGILVAAALVTAVALGIHWRLRGDLSWKKHLFSYRPAAPYEKAALVVAVVVFAIFLLNYDRQQFQYACINGVVMQSITVDAARPFDPHGGLEPGSDNATASQHQDWGKPERRSANAKMDLLDVHGTGQRLGTTAVIAPFVRLFGVFGFRLVYALLPALCFLFGVRLLRTLNVDERLAIVGTLLALLNPYVLKILILDENVMAFCFVTAALAILMERGHPALAGIAFGAALGIRHVDLFFAPAALILIGRNPRAIGAFLGATALAALPCALHHVATYGSLFSHEHFADEVFQAFPHGLLGWEFQYTGLLNYPFYESWIRTPYNPLPTLLYYPINMLAHLGSILAAIGLIGGLSLWRQTTLRWALALWIVPQFLLLGVLENWMDPNKMGVIIILFPVLIVAFGLGLQWLFFGQSRRAIRLGSLIAGALALSFCAFAAKQIHVTDDPRFYEKYPNVRPERAEYFENEMAHLTEGNLLPSMTLLQQYAAFDLGQRFGSLGSDYVDRNFRRIAPAVESTVQRPVNLTIDLSRPLMGRSDFATLNTSHLVIDTHPSQPATQLTGLTAWDGLSAKIRVARDKNHAVSLYLSFGKDGFADVYSQRYFSIEERPRPALVTRTAAGSRFTLQLQEGDLLTIFETVSLDEVLIYAWDIKIGADQLEIGRPRKIFHN